jgi:hypothetical protein
MKTPVCKLSHLGIIDQPLAKQDPERARNPAFAGHGVEQAPDRRMSTKVFTGKPTSQAHHKLLRPGNV